MGDIGGIAQAGASLGAAGIQAGATVSAANAQADAAKYAANQAYNAATQANQLQQNEFNQQQSNLAPWLQAGRQGLGDLLNGLNTGQFNADNAYNGLYQQNPNSGVNTQVALPSGFSYNGQDLQNDPGYQFQLNQGLQALENQQSATGISGGAAAKELERYAQDYAGTSYNNAYNRALGTYQQNFQNQFNTQQANIGNAESDYQNAFNRGLTEQQNNYNVSLNNQNTNWNRMASLAGLGQTANGQLGSAGAQYASAVGNNLMGAAGAAGNYATQGANASAAGMVGLSNIAGNTVNSINNIFQGQQLMNSLKGYQNAGDYNAAMNPYGGYETPVTANWQIPGI